MCAVCKGHRTSLRAKKFFPAAPILRLVGTTPAAQLRAALILLLQKESCVLKFYFCFLLIYMVIKISAYLRRQTKRMEEENVSYL